MVGKNAKEKQKDTGDCVIPRYFKSSSLAPETCSVQFACEREVKEGCNWTQSQNMFIQ